MYTCTHKHTHNIHTWDILQEQHLEGVDTVVEKWNAFIPYFSSYYIHSTQLPALALSVGTRRKSCIAESSSINVFPGRARLQNVYQIVWQIDCFISGFVWCVMDFVSHCLFNLSKWVRRSIKNFNEWIVLLLHISTVATDCHLVKTCLILVNVSCSCFSYLHVNTWS